VSPRARKAQAVPRPRRGECPVSSKVGYLRLPLARQAAQRFAGHLLRNGKLVRPIYAYVCPGCDRFHMTRMKHYRGGPEHQLIYPAPPLDAQLWAMPEEHRQRVTEELMADGLIAEEDRALHRLPDPRPVPVRQSYANRPRGLRR